MANEQNQPLDANSRLKARLRPSVPPRDTSLLKRHTDEEEAIAPVIKLPKPTAEPEFEEAEATNKSAKAQSQNSLLDKPQKLVSFTLRVDEAIDRGIKSLCSNERITKETFLEAAYLACQEDNQMLEQILEIAKARRQERREAGVLRRAKAMTKYLE